MNRKLYLGIMSFFGVVFLFTITLLPFYNPIYFYLQHISLFLFMAMFIYFLLKIGYNRLIKRITKTTYLKAYTLFVFGVLLVLFSNVQLYMIEKYQTPKTISCAYYDTYQNAIYYSQIAENCPVLIIQTQTNDQLSFTVYERIEGISERGYMDLDINADIYYSAVLRTDIDIMYDIYGNITEATAQKSSNILLKQNDDEYKVYNSLIYHIENQVIYQLETPVSFVSQQSTGILEDTFVDFGDINTVTHYLDNQYTFTYKQYSSVKTYADNNDTIAEERYSILIQEDIYNDSSFSGDPLESTILQQLDASCDTTLCTISQKELNLPTAEYVTLQDSSILENVSDETLLISNDTISLTYDVYRYNEPVEDTTTIVYTPYKDYGFIFKSNTKSYSSLWTQPIKRDTFVYQRHDYIEHGDIYSILHTTDYGYKVINKNATMSHISDQPYPIAFISSMSFEVELYHRVNHIFDYSHRSSYNLTENDEIIYQKNPLVFTLLTYQ